MKKIDVHNKNLPMDSGSLGGKYVTDLSEREKSEQWTIDNNGARRRLVECWSRAMGYHRPISHYNVGKKAEHYSRQHFEEAVTANSDFCKKF